MNRLLAVFLGTFLSLPVWAKTEDVFYHSGKIFVVTGVLALILAALFVYLWRMDRKISKLERGNED